MVVSSRLRLGVVIRGGTPTYVQNGMIEADASLGDLPRVSHLFIRSTFGRMTFTDVNGTQVTCFRNGNDSVELDPGGQGEVGQRSAYLPISILRSW